MHYERQIIHLNVADFAVAVERVCDCRLRERPVMIAAVATARAVVLDMSDEAFQQGVRKGMPLRQAQRRCRDAVVLPPHLDRYVRAMQGLIRPALAYSPLVEPADDNGHLFLDVTGTHRLFGPAPDVGWRLRREIKRALGLDPIWTVAPNKLVAKVASRLVKPVGEYIVAGGEEAHFLAPQPIDLLPGLETAELRQLFDFNITRVGEIASLSAAQLRVPFGKRADRIHDLARGIDPSPVRPGQASRPTVSFDHIFAEDTNETRGVENILYQLVERAGATLRDQRLATRRLGIFLGYGDGVQTVRQATARMAVASDFQLFDLARLALGRAWTRRVRLRSLRLTCDRLTRPPAQLELFAASRQARQNREALTAALDHIRHRHGPASITPGRLLAA